MEDRQHGTEPNAATGNETEQEVEEKLAQLLPRHISLPRGGAGNRYSEQIFVSALGTAAPCGSSPTASSPRSIRDCPRASARESRSCWLAYITCAQGLQAEIRQP